MAALSTATGHCATAGLATATAHCTAGLISAAAGTHVGQYSATACSSCASGTFQASARATVCVGCSAGSNCATMGLSVVTGQCAAGRYSFTSATLCSACATGSCCATTGLGVPMGQCAAGQYSSPPYSLAFYNGLSSGVDISFTSLIEILPSELDGADWHANVRLLELVSYVADEVVNFNPSAPVDSSTTVSTQSSAWRTGSALFCAALVGRSPSNMPRGEVQKSARPVAMLDGNAPILPSA